MGTLNWEGSRRPLPLFPFRFPAPGTSPYHYYLGDPTTTSTSLLPWITHQKGTNTTTTTNGQRATTVTAPSALSATVSREHVYIRSRSAIADWTRVIHPSSPAPHVRSTPLIPQISRRRQRLGSFRRARTASQTPLSSLGGPATLNLELSPPSPPPATDPRLRNCPANIPSISLLTAVSDCFSCSGSTCSRTSQPSLAFAQLGLPRAMSGMPDAVPLRPAAPVSTQPASTGGFDLLRRATEAMMSK